MVKNDHRLFTTIWNPGIMKQNPMEMVQHGRAMDIDEKTVKGLLTARSLGMAEYLKLVERSPVNWKADFLYLLRSNVPKWLK